MRCLFCGKWFGDAMIYKPGTEVWMQELVPNKKSRAALREHFADKHGRVV